MKTREQKAAAQKANSGDVEEDTVTEIMENIMSNDMPVNS